MKYALTLSEDLNMYGTLHGKGNDNSVSRLTVFRKSP